MGPRHAFGESDANAGDAEQLSAVDVDLVANGEVSLSETQLAFPRKVRVSDKQAAGAISVRSLPMAQPLLPTSSGSSTVKSGAGESLVDRRGAKPSASSGCGGWALGRKSANRALLANSATERAYT